MRASLWLGLHELAMEMREMSLEQIKRHAARGEHTAEPAHLDSGLGGSEMTERLNPAGVAETEAPAALTVALCVIRKLTPRVSDCRFRRRLFDGICAHGVIAGFGVYLTSAEELECGH